MSDTQVDVIYLDFAKAFDSVAHNELLVKLYAMGVTGGVWEWFKGYLNNRHQCVCIGNSRSSLLPVVSGVPQGSILGPLLFLVYVNDLPQVLQHSCLALFADDAKCLKQVSRYNDCEELQQDLTSLGGWSSRWRLKFKAPKCVHLRFCKKDPPLDSSYTISNTRVGTSVTHRDLGVIASSDLSWSSHYKYVASRAYRTLGLLRRTFKSVGSVEAKKALYMTLVRTQVLYCSQVWRPYLIKDIVLLEKIQRRATKFILADYVSDYKSRLVALGLLPLMAEMEMGDVMFYFRNLKAPGDHFNVNHFLQFSSKPTRSGSKGRLEHTRSTTTQARNSFFNRLPRLWNSLPPQDLDVSVTTFKRKLREVFVSNFIRNFNPSIPCTFHLVCPCHRCSHTPHAAVFN